MTQRSHFQRSKCRVSKWCPHTRVHSGGVHNHHEAEETRAPQHPRTDRTCSLLSLKKEILPPTAARGP